MPTSPSDHPGPGEDPRDAKLRDAEQPPPDEGEAAAQVFRVVDLEPRRVLGHVRERERRVLVGSEGTEGVEGDPPRPAQHADVEAEDPPRVAPGEQHCEERDHRQHEEREPEKEEHDVVRNCEKPLDEPQPSAQVRRELALQGDRRPSHRNLHDRPPPTARFPATAARAIGEKHASRCEQLPIHGSSCSPPPPALGAERGRQPAVRIGVVPDALGRGTRKRGKRKGGMRCHR